MKNYLSSTTNFAAVEVDRQFLEELRETKMQITKLEYGMEATIPHANIPYANIKPSLRGEITIAEGEDEALALEKLKQFIANAWDLEMLRVAAMTGRTNE